MIRRCFISAFQGWYYQGSLELKFFAINFLFHELINIQVHLLVEDDFKTITMKDIKNKKEPESMQVNIVYLPSYRFDLKERNV